MNICASAWFNGLDNTTGDSRCTCTTHLGNRNSSSCLYQRRVNGVSVNSRGTLNLLHTSGAWLSKGARAHFLCRCAGSRGYNSKFVGINSLRSGSLKVFVVFHRRSASVAAARSAWIMASTCTNRLITLVPNRFAHDCTPCHTIVLFRTCGRCTFDWSQPCSYCPVAVCPTAPWSVRACIHPWCTVQWVPLPTDSRTTTTPCLSPTIVRVLYPASFECFAYTWKNVCDTNPCNTHLETKMNLVQLFTFVVNPFLHANIADHTQIFKNE
jgi:hypothetical protein